MRRRDAALRVVLSLTIVFGASGRSFAEMSADFANPSAGQNYSKGGNPSYSGFADWIGTDDGDSADPTPSRFEIDLVFSSTDNLEGAVIMDSENATVTSQDNGIGSAAWENPSPSTITMSQYENQTTGYYFKCVPSFDGVFYQDDDGLVIYGSVALGTIQ